MRFLPRMAAALAAAALFPVMAAAQQPAPQGPPQGGRGGVRGAAPARQAPNRPQLTEQQREQVRALDEQQRHAAETARRELGDLHRQLNEQLSAAQVDNAKVNALRTQIVQKETALAQARVDRLAKLSSILTAEQRQALGGRGLGQMFGPGGGPGGMVRGGGMQGGRGMARRGSMAGRGGAVMQRQQGVERQLRAQRGARGRMAPGNDARLRAEIRRLELQLEALRRRIR